MSVPIIYHVDRIRDGKSFATRRVDAIQKGNVVFSLLASFQVYQLSPQQLKGRSTLWEIVNKHENNCTDIRYPYAFYILRNCVIHSLRANIYLIEL